jgi:hypothetical protein
MGWTILNAKPAAGWKNHLDAVIAGGSADMRWEVLASAVGADGNYYAAVERKRVPGGSRKVYAVVGVIEGLGYKLMSEEEHPYYYGAPADVLIKLEPTADPYALKWRANCAGDPLAAVIKAGELPGGGA